MKDLVLVVIRSDTRHQQHIPFFGQTLRIGHNAYSDIVLPEDFVPHADYHAVIYGSEGQTLLADPEQIGTTYLNGKLLNGTEPFSPDMTAYIGNPVQTPLYFKILLESPQYTQQMQSPAWDAPTLSNMLHSVLDNPQPNTTPYLQFGWKFDESYTYVLSPDTPLLVGRAPTSNLRLPQDLTFVSSAHFLIQWDGNQYLIEDKGSTNGTWVNQYQLMPQRPYILMNGDIISIRVTGRDPVWFAYYVPQATPPPNTYTQDTDHTTPPVNRDVTSDTQPNPSDAQEPAPKQQPTLWERIKRIFN